MAEFSSIGYSSLVTHRRLLSCLLRCSCLLSLLLRNCRQSEELAAGPIFYRQKTGFTGRKLVLPVMSWAGCIIYPQFRLHNAVVHVVRLMSTGHLVCVCVCVCDAFIFECGRGGCSVEEVEV